MGPDGGRRDDPEARKPRWQGASRQGTAGGRGVPRPTRRQRGAIKKPPIPSGLEADVPPAVLRELRRHLSDPNDVARAITAAGEALASEQPEQALTYLEWAKSVAPRAASIREGLGVALYQAEEWRRALAELQAYRRLSGRADQNHLIADCLRALGRPVAAVAEAVQQMDPERDGVERVAEGVIVWASTLADQGHIAAGREVLRRWLAPRASPSQPEDHDLRLWYVAGDLAERDDDRDAAVRWFGRVAAVDEGLFDVADRLRRLAGGEPTAGTY